MPTMTPEAMAKANEKRINAIERKLDAMERDKQKVSVDALTKKVDQLTTIVKAQDAQLKMLVGGAKGVDTKAIEKRLESQERKIAEAEKTQRMAATMKDSEAAAKHIAKLQKNEDLLKTTLATIAAKQKQEDDQIKAALKKQADDMAKEMKKHSDDIAKDMKAFAEKSVIEGRLNALEAMVRSTIGKR